MLHKHVKNYRYWSTWSLQSPITTRAPGVAAVWKINETKRKNLKKKMSKHIAKPTIESTRRQSKTNWPIMIIDDQKWSNLAKTWLKGAIDQCNLSHRSIGYAITIIARTILSPYTDTIDRMTTMRSSVLISQHVVRGETCSSSNRNFSCS